MTDPLDLDAIRTRCERATPGPWHQGGLTGDDRADTPWEEGGHRHLVIASVARDMADDLGPGDPSLIATCESGHHKEAFADDARFIAHARTDIPALLARVEQLAGALEDLVAYARSGWTDGTYGYCLCCDSSLTGKGKGQRAATFDEIQHDPECPVPGARTLLGAPREGPGEER